MNKTTEEILKSWYSAHKQAGENAKLLLLDYTKFSNFCTALMNVITIVDYMLYELPEGGEDFPEELNRHLKANKNKSCDRCSMMSTRRGRHPECLEKSNEWFSSQRALMEFVEVIYF